MTIDEVGDGVLSRPESSEKLFAETCPWKARTARRAAPVSILLLTLLTYAGSFNGGFISDDIGAVRGNHLLDSLGWENVKAIFASFDDVNYIPIKVLSLAVDYRLWGPGPAGFHVTNVLIHVLCALLVYRILLRLELGVLPAFFVAALWAVHPLQVESVAWISERKNVLSGLFFFAAFDVYLSYSEHPRTASYLGLLLVYLLALLSKENTMVLPALFLAFEATFRFRLRRRDVLASLPLFLFGAAALWYTLAGRPIHKFPYYGGSAIVTWLSSSVVVMRYLKNALLPTDLSFYYDVPLRGSALDPPVFASLLSLAAIAAAAAALSLRRQRSGFWVLWFGITLVPMLNVIPFPSLMSDRYMYLPLLGLLVLAGEGARAVARTRVLRHTLAVGAAAAVFACACLSAQRVEVFDNPVSLWIDWARRVPFRPAEPTYLRPDWPDYATSVRELRHVLADDPSSAAAHHNLGAVYLGTSHVAEAIPELETARALAPRHRLILETLGRAYAAAGRLEEAETVLRRAAELDPYGFYAHRALARVLLARRDLAGARRALAVCASIHPVGTPYASTWATERALLERLEAAGDRAM